MDIEETSLLSMYLNFRRYLDCICFENLVKMSGDGFIKIKHNENTVGFLMIIDDYIDAIYVLPEYRRLGLARKAVLDAWNSGIKMRTLHSTNTLALNTFVFGNKDKDNNLKKLYSYEDKNQNLNIHFNTKIFNVLRVVRDGDIVTSLPYLPINNPYRHLGGLILVNKEVNSMNYCPKDIGEDYPDKECDRDVSINIKYHTYYFNQDTKVSGICD